VARIRPLALARRLKLDPDQVVAACLRGARSGLLVLLWDILCPICRIPSEVKDTLRELKGHGRCEACNLDYELDFANAIELIFRVHPEIRSTEVGTYCVGGPSHSPHVVVQARVAPAETLELDLRLPEGAYRLRGPQLPWSLDFQVETNAPASRWDVRLSQGLSPNYPRSLQAGRQAITVTNDFEGEVLVRLERTAPRADALTAARASSLAMFRQLFPAEVLSPGNLIGIANVTLLATAIDGIRNVYRTLGDARAFELIHEHLRVLEDKVRREGGAFIRTSGTGTLAVFHQPAAAVRAGLALQSAMQEGEKTRALRLRVGIHSGAALAATINDKLDYFGTTVAAVEESLDLIRGGELILTEAVATNPEVVSVLQRQGIEGRLVKADRPDHALTDSHCLVFRVPVGGPPGKSA
jgi:eukaryotic-like serine/threonine-protein kinase